MPVWPERRPTTGLQLHASHVWVVPWVRVARSLSQRRCVQRLLRGCLAGTLGGVLESLLTVPPLPSAPGSRVLSAAERGVEDKVLPGQGHEPSPVSLCQASGEGLCGQPPWHLRADTRATARSFSLRAPASAVIPTHR